MQHCQHGCMPRQGGTSGSRDPFLPPDVPPPSGSGRLSRMRGNSRRARGRQGPSSPDVRAVPGPDDVDHMAACLSPCECCRSRHRQRKMTFLMHSFYVGLSALDLALFLRAHSTPTHPTQGLPMPCKVRWMCAPFWGNQGLWLLRRLCGGCCCCGCCNRCVSQCAFSAGTGVVLGRSRTPCMGACLLKRGGVSSRGQRARTQHPVACRWL